jgi:dTMP kinase
MAKRKERLEQGAQRLRERAAELRKRIANGETVEAPSPNSKRPPRSLEEQAARFEEQAKRMDERAKNLDSASAGGAGGTGERSPELARQRRHQMRKSHINRRWGGATLRDAEAQAELKLHAERVAKLKRIRSLAMDKGKDDPLAKRAKDLMSKEEERHEAHMKAIQARVAPAAAAAAAAAPGATTPASTAPTPAEESK